MTDPHAFVHPLVCESLDSLSIRDVSKGDHFGDVPEHWPEAEWVESGDGSYGDWNVEDDRGWLRAFVSDTDAGAVTYVWYEFYFRTRYSLQHVVRTALARSRAQVVLPFVDPQDGYLYIPPGRVYGFDGDGDLRRIGLGLSAVYGERQWYEEIYRRAVESSGGSFFAPGHHPSAPGHPR
ncbi:MAG: hypothetical protein AAF845_06260 [Bacteroidota bacterium]